MSGGSARIRRRSSSRSWPVYRAKVTGSPPSGYPNRRNFSSSPSWEFASAFIGYTTMAFTPGRRRPPSAVFPRNTLSTIGTM
jgi:hypothetical protein